jgi:hypothetical protein
VSHGSIRVIRHRLCCLSSSCLQVASSAFHADRQRTQRCPLEQRASPLTPADPAGASGAGAGAAAAAAALAALKAAVQAAGRAPRGGAAPRAGAGRAPRAGKGPPRGPAVVVLDEMDQLLAGDQAVLTELFLLPKVPLLPPSQSPMCCPAQKEHPHGAAHKEHTLMVPPTWRTLMVLPTRSILTCPSVPPTRSAPAWPNVLPSRRHKQHSSRVAGRALSACAPVAPSPRQPVCRATRGREAAAERPARARRQLPGARLVLAGVANALDLTERALPALAGLGARPALLPFPAYDAGQLQALLGQRLGRLPGPVFAPQALRLCAKKARARPIAWPDGRSVC